MRAGAQGPPRLARRFLARTVDFDDRSDILENFDELYRARHARGSKLRADLWYWGQALTFTARVWMGGAGPERTRPRRLLANFIEDARYALRSFRRRPTFALAVVATLGLGFGANAAVFAVVNEAILQPLPYPDADRLAWVWPSGAQPLTARQFDELQPAARTAELTAFASRQYAVLGGESPHEVSGASVWHNHFDVVRVPPERGRGFTVDDATPGAEPVAVISDGLWRRQFGSDPDVIGGRVELYTAAVIPMIAGAFAGERYTVIGVLPEGYRPFGYDADVYTPLIRDPAQPSFANMGELAVVGRLGPGSTPDDLRRELIALSGTLPTLESLRDALDAERVVELRSAIEGSLRSTLLLAWGAVFAVLLIASVNVANLMLVRALGRAREFSIRAAVGAGRARVVRQLLTESLILSAVAAAVGVGVAALLLPTLARLIPAGLLPPGPIEINGTVAAYSLATLVLISLLAGAAPAIWHDSARAGRGSRGSVGSTRRRRRFTTALIVGELALALVLVHGAVMLVDSLGRLSAVDVGFDPAGVTTMRVAPSSAPYRDADRRRELYANILAQIDAMPGVESSGAIHFLPIEEGGPGVGFILDPADPESRQGSGYRIVTPGYFETMGITVVRGRSITADDRRGGTRVGLINQSLATQLWPGEDALGRTLYRTNGNLFFTVVGIAADVRQAAVGQPPQPEIYIPLEQSEWASAMNVVVRTAGLRPELERQLRRIVSDLDPAIPVTRVKSMEAVLVTATSDTRFYGTVFGVFALLALVLGGVGIYGVVSAVVSERTDEIGVRLALGATGGGILRHELEQGARLIAAGLVVGGLGAAFASRLFENLLFEVSALDTGVLASAALSLVAAAAAGVVIPAVRAARIDPVVALREGDSS